MVLLEPEQSNLTSTNLVIRLFEKESLFFYLVTHRSVLYYALIVPFNAG